MTEKGTTLTSFDLDVSDREAVITELDLLPERTIIRCTLARNRRAADVWEKYSSGRWLHLDPGDRYDGEETFESGILLSMGYGYITVIFDGADA